MTSDRIKEIQLATAYPDSISVMLALKQVWNECQQEKNKHSEDIFISLIQFIVSQETLENTSSVSKTTAKYYLDKFKKENPSTV